MAGTMHVGRQNSDGPSLRLNSLQNPDQMGNATDRDAQVARQVGEQFAKPDEFGERTSSSIGSAPIVSPREMRSNPPKQLSAEAYTMRLRTETITTESSYRFYKDMHHLQEESTDFEPIPLGHHEDIKYVLVPENTWVVPHHDEVEDTATAPPNDSSHTDDLAELLELRFINEQTTAASDLFSGKNGICGLYLGALGYVCGKAPFEVKETPFSVFLDAFSTHKSLWIVSLLDDNIGNYEDEGYGEGFEQHTKTSSVLPGLPDHDAFTAARIMSAEKLSHKSYGPLYDPAAKSCFYNGLIKPYTIPESKMSALRECGDASIQSSMDSSTDDRIPPDAVIVTCPPSASTSVPSRQYAN